MPKAKIVQLDRIVDPSVSAPDRPTPVPVEEPVKQAEEAAPKSAKK